MTPTAWVYVHAAAAPGPYPFHAAKTTTPPAIRLLERVRYVPLADPLARS